MKYIFSCKYFANCPIHDGGDYSGLKIVETEEELLDFVLENLNIFHVMDLILIDDNQNVIDNIYFEYESETHRYNGIKYYVGDKLIKRTMDNGSGELIWIDCE